MSQDEKPSDSEDPEAATKIGENEPENDKGETKLSAAQSSDEKAKFKVIADIHSGMVLVAPVATAPDGDDLDTVNPKISADEPRGPLN